MGIETSDDAAVYRLDDEKAVISTADFITPPVDDPWWFGQIAAANSLSDVYAMGGKPLTAINLVMFPAKILDKEVLKEILRGGNEKIIEAGATLVGGHTVEDDEPKYGLSVTGIVNPKRVLTNAGAEDGDALVLTKPIGTGVLFNANRSRKLPYKSLEEILPTIAALNDKALDVALEFGLHACTDITGFGIVGHALEMAKGSKVDISIEFDKLPIYPNVLEMYRKGETTGSNIGNRQMTNGAFVIESRDRPLDAFEEELLFDPQTSGGLMFSLPKEEAPKLVSKLIAAGIEHSAIIASVKASTEPKIRII